MSERLCAVCNLIFFDPTPQPGTYSPHHSTIGDLLQAANKGCYICRSITKSYQWSDIDYMFSKGFLFTFSRSGPQELLPFGSLIVKAVCDIDDDDCRRKFNQTIKDFNEIREEVFPSIQLMAAWDQHYHVDFHFLLWPFENEATGGHGHITTPSSVLSDSATMGLLKHWFTECCNNHPFCLPPAPSFSPTRLLLIENEHSARIVETKDWNVDHPYVALSHCWGNANRLKLQKSNMADFLKHLSISELPTTYREGISVSLALGISYIWIDSLCIIQDDEEDWTKEAAMMKNVFEHCSLNLSATAAADSSQSNFRHRDPAIIPPLEVTFNQGEGKPIQSKFWLTTDWTKMRRDEIIYSPLHSRAWVFQETKLSRRRIELARSQIWWFCQHNWACEMHPLGVWNFDEYFWLNDGDSQQHVNMRKRRSVHPSPLLSMSSLREPSSQAPAIVAYSNTNPEQTHERHWFEQVQVYSNCAITKTKDRLIAFAGIAQSYAQGLGRSLDDYLAGIWRQELPHSLCFSSTHEKISYRPDEYRAPSWSWASLEGPVSIGGYLLRKGTIAPLCAVVNAKVIHQTKHYQAGEVKGGVIHLRGHLVQLILGSQVPKWPNDKRIEELAGKIVLHTDFDEGRNVKNSITSHPVVSYLEHPQGQLDQRKLGIVDEAVRKSISFKELDELSEHLRLFMLPIMRDDRMTFPRVPCLVLCQTLDDFFAGNDIYQRVGSHLWWVYKKESLEDLETIPERDVYII